MKKIKDNRGFSLVELIVVIAIIVILTALIVPNVLGYINKTNMTMAKKSAEAIYNASLNYLYSEIGAGKTFEPNSELDVTVLWSEDVKLLNEDDNYQVVEIRLNDQGTLVEYVYYEDKTGNKADFPVGFSGKVD